MIIRLILLAIVSLLQLISIHVSAQSVAMPDAASLRIDEYLNQSVDNGYSGSVLVAKDGEILLSKGYGWADRKMKIPNRPGTVFNIGSVTKQFTAAAILKLQEAGKLRTLDNLAEWFPGAPSDKRGITIHQLLTHTSGISPRTGGFRYDEAGKRQFLREFFESELMYPPGTRHTYANANYIVLAAIVEAASGQDYESFLRNHFWQPLQMNHTGYKSIGFSSEQAAHGYYYNDTDGAWKDWGITQEYLPYRDNHWYSIGKGDIYSTVEDLYTWHKALQEFSVLSPESKRLMETAYAAENEAQTSYYGYGWAIYTSLRGTKIVAHNGSNGIYFADFLRFIEEDLVVISLSNTRLNQKSENIAWEMAAMVSDPDYQARPMPKNPYELVFDFIRTHSPEDALQLAEFIEDRTGSSLKDKALLNRIGFKQVSEALDKDWGIALLKLNTMLFPEDGNLWDSLGEGYFLINDTDYARESFEKALELGAGNACHWCENSQDKLDQLNGQ